MQRMPRLTHFSELRSLTFHDFEQESADEPSPIDMVVEAASALQFMQISGDLICGKRFLSTYSGWYAIEREAQGSHTILRQATNEEAAGCDWRWWGGFYTEIGSDLWFNNWK
jgi:hypothetical protein